MFVLICRKDQKHVLQKGMKDWTFKVYLITGEFGSWFRLIESLKMTCARPYAWFLNFSSSVRGLDCFFQPRVFAKLSKINCDLPTSLKWISRVNFDLPKGSRMTINFELLNVSKMIGLKICVSQVLEKLETSNLDIR